MSKKLELTWIGKENKINVEPRILIEIPELSNISAIVNSTSSFDNMLIHGDNLLALKALQSDFSRKIKCIYIDPPYNTGAAFEHYDDNLEHSTWLNLMNERIRILWDLLTDDGLLAIQIDDNEFARLYLLLCEICHERNIKVICVKMSEATGVKMASVNKAGSIPKLKEYIILAKKDGIRNLNLEKIPKEKWDKEYKTYCSNISDDELILLKDILSKEDATENEILIADNLLKNIIFSNVNDVAMKEIGSNANEEWCFNNAHRIVQFVTLTGGARDIAIQKKQQLLNNLPSAFCIQTKKGKMYAIRADFNTETSLSRCKILFADQYLTVNPGDLWVDIKTTGLDNEGCVDFKKSKKPERLIRRIIRLNTKENDIVLDSFLGSGTTCAVAHKMGRKWIGIEMGDHAYSHCKVRLDKVISGEDNGGISKQINWQGGGGYRFYELAPTLIEEDAFGQPIINSNYNATMLASAIAKHEGYNYNPDENCYWKQSKNDNNSFLYVTTQHVNSDVIESIKTELKDDEFLLIVCKSYDTNCNFGNRNINIKKIPQSLLKNCEFGVDNYNLNIINPPVYEEEEEDDE